MDRAADELFSAADTVPGVRFSCSAIVFRVTRSGLRAPGLALCAVFIGCLDVTCRTASGAAVCFRPSGLELCYMPKNQHHAPCPPVSYDVWTLFCGTQTRLC